MWVRNLGTLECTQLLDANRLAHLACSNDGRPYIVPIYYAHAENTLYAFSMPGKKIDWMRANPLVSVLVEEHKKGREWKSVIADGRYEELPDRIGSAGLCLVIAEQACRLVGAWSPEASGASNVGPFPAYFLPRSHRAAYRARSKRVIVRFQC